jgi:hypothetical protein
VSLFPIVLFFTSFSLCGFDWLKNDVEYLHIFVVEAGHVPY